MANGEVRKARKEVKEAKVKKKVDKKVAKAKLKKAFKNAIGDKVGVAKAKRKLKKTQLKGAKKLVKKTSMYGEDAGKRVGMDLNKSNFKLNLPSSLVFTFWPLIVISEFLFPGVSPEISI